MAKQKTKIVPTKKAGSTEVLPLLRDPRAAADQIDAILFFLHKRYGSESTDREMPSMRTFLISNMNVIFTDAVDQITIEKRLDQSGLSILAPSPSKAEEEARRIFLLNEFGDLLIKAQKQGLAQLREMLLGILDNEGKERLVSEFIKNKRAHPTPKK